MKKKTRALEDGVLSGSSGLQGCMRDLSLDDRRIGFPEMLETVEVRSGCAWDFPCASAPCSEGEVCTQDGLTGHSCSCTNPPCTGASPTPLGKLILN